MDKIPTIEYAKAQPPKLRQPEGEMGQKVGNLMNDGNRPMNLQTLAALDAKKGEHILEIGMGNGAFVKNILSIDPTLRYTGIDFSPLMVEESNQRNSNYVTNGQAAFAEANLEALPLDDNSVDKAFTINTFYFWEDITQCLSEFKRVLKSGGKVFLSVRPKETLDQFPFCEYGFRKWTKSQIMDELSLHNFVNIEVTHVIEPEKDGFGTKMAFETLIFECTVA
jgi:ubiquinone/menaquinone biosynthesis C-methylase UbiE